MEKYTYADGSIMDFLRTQTLKMLAYKCGSAENVLYFISLLDSVFKFYNVCLKIKAPGKLLTDGGAKVVNIQ